MISNRVILAILTVFLLAGCAVIYCVDNDDYTATVNTDSGGVDYTISGFMPCDYTFKVYSNTDVPDRLYFYYDEDYEHFYDIERQKTFFNDLERVLKARGFDEIQYVDANGLKGLIDDPSKTAGSELFLISGMIPDTIYSATEMRLTEWMDNGGTVFWAGPEIGLYISHTDGYDEADNGRILKDHVNGGIQQDIRTISELGYVTGFSLNRHLQFGLEKDYPGAVCLSTCSDDYSSASVLKYSAGRIYIVGGDIMDSVITHHTALAEIIICGINENTVLKSTETFHKGYGDTSGTFDCPVVSGDVVLLTIGKPYSSWARAYPVA